MEAWFSHTSDVPIVIASVSVAIKHVGIMGFSYLSLRGLARTIEHLFVIARGVSLVAIKRL